MSRNTMQHAAVRTKKGFDVLLVGYSNSNCVFVFFLFILDVKLVGYTSRGHTGFLIHLPSAVHASFFLARRIQPFLSLVDREVDFVY